MIKKVNPRKKYSEMEKEILSYWKEGKIFEKSVKNRNEGKVYSFYDGPPFITGVPHYGTLLSSVVKDCVPRFWTMKGFKVERRWGWDCHGLPAENMVEKKLGIKSKKEIEENVGIKKFNESCFLETSKIASEWEDIVDRIGRWVDFKGAYKTMDSDYMESVWWAFKELYKKGLIYEDVRISLYCPRCATPLSNFEIAMDNSYQTDVDVATFVKFELEDSISEGVQINKTNGKTYFLVWTTTPWTLLANVALAVNKELKYVLVKDKKSSDSYILAKDRLEVLEDLDCDEIQEFKGNDLIGLRYKPLFESLSAEEAKKAYFVLTEDFVSASDGSGIVHIAPAYGEDDFNTRKKYDIPLILNVDQESKFLEGPWKGQAVWDVNNDIVDYLEEKGILFKKDEFTHSYPHCHRCNSKLIYKAQPAWYVNIDKIRSQLLSNSEKINWFPDHFKDGRFKQGIKNAPDWNISRDRYWGTAIPVWKCEKKDCENIKVIGSYEELKKEAGVSLKDYHRPYIDDVEVVCDKCGGKMKRIPQVFDCWVESGSMPFAQFHYPFNNKEKFPKTFPTDFIAEYVGQVRAWFYVLHVLATGVFGKEAYKNVIVTGNIAGEDGRKMSKSLGNFTDPNIILEKYSADALRFYLLSSPLLRGQDVSFSNEAVDDIQRKFLGTLWNSYSFFTLYASIDNWFPDKDSEHELDFKRNILDRWIVSELNLLIKTVDEKMTKYDIVAALKPMKQFVDDLSNWYIRRSRRRFWKSESDQDKLAAYKTLHRVLFVFAEVIAPFCPFIADEMYKNLSSDESVHLCDFPEYEEQLIDLNLSEKMSKVRKIVEIGLSLRAESGIKVRQPLPELVFSSKGEELEIAFLELIKDEINVKRVTQKETRDCIENSALKFKDDKNLIVALDIEIDEALKMEGLMRDLIRKIQNTRKNIGLEIEDRIELYYSGDSKVFEMFKADISKEVLAVKLEPVSEEFKSKEGVNHKRIKLSDLEVDVYIEKVV